jgi:hypothetical protein
MDPDDVEDSRAPILGGAAADDPFAGPDDPTAEDVIFMGDLSRALGAPGTPDELARLDADTAAFVAARRATVSELAAGAPVPLVPVARPARLAAGAVAATLATVLLAGTAAAALTGALPAPAQQVAHNLLGLPAPASDTATAATSSAAGTGSGTTQQGTGTTAAPTTPPAAAVPGLCRAFLARPSDSPATESTAYARLAELAAASGQSVEAFCAAALASAPGQSAKPSTPPGQSAKPSTPPGQTKTPPGQTKTPPGQTKTPPGQTAKPSVPPGQTKTPPGQTKTPPGQTKTPAGQTR